MTRPPPTPSEIQTFLAALRTERKQLLALARDGNADGTQRLAAAADVISEHILAADEELRVQNEQLLSSNTRLDSLVEAYESMFAHASVPAVQTDVDGLIVRVNHAARQLLQLPSQPKRSYTVTSLVHADDRAAVRALISRVRSSGFAEDAAPTEVRVLRRDGSEELAVMSVHASTDPELQPVLHWELQRRATPVEPDADHNPGPNTAIAFADAASAMAAPETLTETLREVVGQARRMVPGVTEAGVLLRRTRGALEVPLGGEQEGDPDGTGLAGACDRLHVTLDEGPAVTAIADDVPVVVSDVANDGRWLQFGARATDLGVRSLMALPLRSPRGPIGALTLYAAVPAAFDAGSELTATAFAALAAIAIAQADLEANLRLGLQTREEIGRAVGIVMERHRVSATRAFDMLVFASQRAHLKLREVAGWVNETGEDPSNLIPMRKPNPQRRPSHGGGSTGPRAVG